MTTRILEQTGTTLVIGGTGKTGRRVAQRLMAMDGNVRVGSRTADLPFDWENRATWAPALHDVESIYISYYPDLAVPGAVDAVQELNDLAVKTGVKRMVLLSGRGEEEAQRAEAVVKSAGAEWTIVRSAWFSQNFSENYLLEPILQGEVILPVGDVLEPFVDADDIASVAVAALTEDGHAGQVYEVTGPRLLTFEQAVREIADATGREIRFATVSSEEYSEILRQHDVPAEFVGLLEYLFGEVLDGRNACLADGVQRALGRKPKDFAEYARETAATGVWGVER
jgi:uncharacterized protein YbjT (DUF2867 family)